MKKRYYTLFAREAGTRKWKRFRRSAFTKQYAVSVYQDTMIGLSFEPMPGRQWELRPTEKDFAPVEIHDNRPMLSGRDIPQ